MLNSQAINHKPYASIARRSMSYLLDSSFMFIGFVITQWVIFVPIRRFIQGSDEWFMSGLYTELYVLLTVSLPVWLYFAICEWSAWQATLGKRLLGLRTMDATTGNRIGFGTAVVRTIIKLLPWEIAHITNNFPVPMWYDPEPGFRLGFVIVLVLIILYIGLAIFTHRKQSLHDLVVQSVVVYQKRNCLLA